MGSNTIFLANLGEIARNARKCTMWQITCHCNWIKMGMRLWKIWNVYFPPPMMLFSRRLIPLAKKNPPDELYELSQHCLHENNAISAQDCAVRDGEWLAWCQRSKMKPESVLYCSSKEYARTPSNNKPRMTLRVPLLLLPATQRFVLNKITL